MAKTKVVKSTGRFRAGYGGTLRARVREMEFKKHAPHRCPICDTRGSVTRVAAGIWTFSKCGGRFAGGAYVPKTQVAAAQIRIQTEAAPTKTPEEPK